MNNKEMNKNIILASKSPRRIELLENAGYTVLSCPSEIDESLIVCPDPKELVVKLAYAKAEKVKDGLTDGSISLPISYGDSPIVAADTIVYSDKIIGKPMDKDDALSILMGLSGSSHKVFTGVAILFANKKTAVSFCEETTVYFTSYSESELEPYLETSEPYDKAGAYGIQGYFSRYVDHIEGSYTNVMGLPMERLSEELLKL